MKARIAWLCFILIVLVLSVSYIGSSIGSHELTLNESSEPSSVRDIRDVHQPETWERDLIVGARFELVGRPAKGAASDASIMETHGPVTEASLEGLYGELNQTRLRALEAQELRMETEQPNSLSSALDAVVLHRTFVLGMARQEQLKAAMSQLREGRYITYEGESPATLYDSRSYVWVDLAGGILPSGEPINVLIPIRIASYESLNGAIEEVREIERVLAQDYAREFNSRSLEERKDLLHVHNEAQRKLLDGKISVSESDALRSHVFPRGVHVDSVSFRAHVHSSLIGESREDANRVK